MALACAILWRADALEGLWFWTVRYALAYTQQIPLERAPEVFLGYAGLVMGSAPLLWLLAGAGLVACFWNERLAGVRLFLLLFAGFSFLAISPGFYFRPHYFLLLLPAVALADIVQITNPSTPSSGSRGG